MSVLGRLRYEEAKAARRIMLLDVLKCSESELDEYISTDQVDGEPVGEWLR